MDPKIFPHRAHRRSSASLAKGEDPGAHISDSGTVDFEASFPRHAGVRSTQEFISDVRGYRTRWPVLVVASLLTVTCIGFAASHILFKQARVSSEIPEQQPEIGPGPDDLAVAPTVSQSDSQLGEASAHQKVSALTQRPKKAFAFHFQAEAEAAVERNPRPDALQSLAASQSIMEIGGYTDATGPNEDAFSAGPTAPDRPGIIPEEKDSSVIKEVYALLASVDTAVESEDMELFLAFLDQTKPGFIRRQQRKARLLFSKFDEIDGTYSDVKIEVLNDEQVAINLHCKVKAAFARSGRPIVLYDGPQQVTLKKAPGAVWKICAID